MHSKPNNNPADRPKSPSQITSMASPFGETRLH
uniref:Uncharacterized protein n=1 Tax=Steinernema glaseri TaxID=37863 RepID=A0A1I8AKD9_9BILA